MLEALSRRDLQSLDRLKNALLSTDAGDYTLAYAQRLVKRAQSYLAPHLGSNGSCGQAVDGLMRLAEAAANRAA